MANNLRLYLLTVILLASVLASCESSKNKSIPAKEDIWDITEPSITPGWITFKQGAKINPKTVFKDYASLFKLSAGNEMVIVSEEKDELGMIHFRYNQFFKEIPVENAEFIIHAKNNHALTANGILALNFPPTEITPLISEQQALQSVMKHISSERYYSEDNLVGDLENENSGNAGSDYRPQGKLIFAEKQNTDSKEWVLAWMFKVYTLPLDRSRQVYINASNGSLLKELPLFANLSCTGGRGDTTFRGNQNFNTSQIDSRFYLSNDCNGNKLTAGLLDGAGKPVSVPDDDNNWTGNNRSLVTSYWALDIVSDYFRLVHRRNSYDNKNSKMIIYNNPNVQDNASGGGGVITIGFGSTNSDNDDYNTVDIVGHEFGHSLIESSAQLGYDVTKESAALNESFSDILGQMVERWEERNLNPDWVIGDQKGCTGAAICRDFKNPKTFNQPDTFKGTFWQTTNIDPHVNGNVQNRWFYLLTDGGTGTNSETKIQYSINGIGIEKAGKIAYRSLTRYLNAASDYVAARAGSIQAAEDLYGINSQEVGQVIKAWCAVGLCTYAQPKEPDQFDKKGGNPNSESPDNNDTLAGATPLGAGGIRIIRGAGNLNWSKDRYPKMKITNLNIFPFSDIDYFRITSPDVKNLLGACSTPSLAFNFTNNVNAKIYSNNGFLIKAYTNASYFSVPISISPGELIISVESVFPGQILDYDMQVSYFFSFNNEQCGEKQEKSKFELIRECVMCDYEILSEINFILDPPYRNKFNVPVRDYYFQYDGKSELLDISVQIVNGNKLRAQLMDERGNVLSSVDNIESNAAGNSLRLKSNGLGEGVYSLRFSEFGNGTEISVGLPSK